MSEGKEKKLDYKSKKQQKFLSKYCNEAKRMAASKNYQSFDSEDDDEKYGVPEIDVDPCDVSSPLVEICRYDDGQSISLAALNETYPRIGVISQEDYDINKECRFNKDRLSPAYLHSQYRTAVNDGQLSECVAKPPNNSHRLPAVVYQLFRDVDSITRCKIIKEIEDVADQYWEAYDKLSANEDGKLTNGQPIDRSLRSCSLYEYFQTCLPSMRYGYTYRQQILSYINDHKYQNSSYGCLFINSKLQIFAVQNHTGTWSAPKGHPKVNDQNEYESTKETCCREVVEEVAITNIRKKKQITTENFDQYFHLDQCLYLDCIVYDYSQKRRIGLYVVHVNVEEFNFKLKDRKENKHCQWVDLDIIRKSQPLNGYDKYHTLRKFIEYLFEHPEVLQN